MAFVHGKGAAIRIKDSGGTVRDLSTYVDEVSLPFRVDTAETTTYGKNSKTYIVGLRDSTLSMRGKFDSTATSGPDVVLSGLLGNPPSASGTQFQYGPEGSATGKVRYHGDCILTSYEVSAPVGDVVSFSAEFQITGDVTRDTSAFA